MDLQLKCITVINKGLVTYIKIQVKGTNKVYSRTGYESFNPGKKTRYPLYRRLGGPRTSVDGCGKTSSPRDSIPGPSIPYRVAIPTVLPRPTHDKYSRNLSVSASLIFRMRTRLKGHAQKLQSVTTCPSSA